MSTNNTTPPPLSAETLKYRLMTGNMSKHGGLRGSLTRCAQKFGAFQSELRSETPDAEKIETSKQDLVQDLSFYQLELAKLVLLHENMLQQVERNQAAEEARNTEIEEWTEKVKASQAEANKAKAVEACFEEYETVAKLINTRNPQSCLQLRSNIAALHKEMETLKKEEATTDNILEVRESQFQLLMQYMLDLKKSLNDPEEQKMTQELAESKATKEATMKQGDEEEQDAMQVDDDEALYDGL